MRTYTLASGWTRSNTGHHYKGWRIRVITATIDGKGPMYWIYTPEGFRYRPPEAGTRYEPIHFRSLRLAKRFVENQVLERPPALSSSTSTQIVNEADRTGGVGGLEERKA